jgi:hypothetical protein
VKCLHEVKGRTEFLHVTGCRLFAVQLRLAIRALPAVARSPIKFSMSPERSIVLARSSPELLVSSNTHEVALTGVDVQSDKRKHV